MQLDYLMASRRLLCIPAIRSLDTDTLAMLLKPNPGLRISDFLLRVGLQPKTYREQLKKHQLLKYLDRVVTTRWHKFSDSKMRGRLERFFKSVESDILFIAATERSTVRKYLLESGISRNTSAVVDIGWSGSLALGIHRLLPSEDDTPLKAYYFGTWETAQKAMRDGVDIDSYYCHLNEPLRRRDLLMEGVELMELLLVAAHPTINGIVHSEGAWKPVYGPSGFTPEQMHLLDNIRDGALQFVDHMLDLFPTPPDGLDLASHLDVVFCRLLTMPDAREAGVFGGFQHLDGFGGYGITRSLAEIPILKRWLWRRRDPNQQIKEAYEAAYWKKGFLAQYRSD